LLNIAKGARLLAPKAMFNADVDVLQNVCNGIGAEWMSNKSRKVITRLLYYAEATAMIHDWEYHHSDGSENTRLGVDEMFLVNGLREVRYRFPQWWNIKRILGERAVLTAHEVLSRTGNKAWNDAFAKRVKQKLESLGLSAIAFFNLTKETI
jgi:hypothetical protein